MQRVPLKKISIGAKNFRRGVDGVGDVQPAVASRVAMLFQQHPASRQRVICAGGISCAGMGNAVNILRKKWTAFERQFPNGRGKCMEAHATCHASAQRADLLLVTYELFR